MTTLKRNKLFLFLTGALLIIGMSACEDLLEQKPPSDGSNLLPEEAIQSAQDLQEVLYSAYDVIANTYDGNGQNLVTLMTDNLERPFNQDDYTAVWLRNTSIFNGNVGDRFRDYYIAVLRSNGSARPIHYEQALTGQNHIPVRIQSEILVGSIKVDLKSYKGLVAPLNISQ